jgi:hypothetical protein
LSSQNEGEPARLPVRHPFGAIDGGLTGGCFGNSLTLGGYPSKANSYHSLSVLLALSILPTVANLEKGKRGHSPF